MIFLRIALMILNILTDHPGLFFFCKLKTGLWMMLECFLTTATKWRCLVADDNNGRSVLWLVMGVWLVDLSSAEVLSHSSSDIIAVLFFMLCDIIAVLHFFP